MNNRYNDRYEDEIDRMRARHSRRKESTVHKAERGRYDYDQNNYDRNAYDDQDYVDSRYESHGRGSYDRQEGRRSGRGSSKARTASSRSRQTGHNQGNSSQRRNKHKKKKPFFRLIILVLLIVAVGIYIRRGTTQTGYWTIAVFGVDSRNGSLGKGALSDVEMLCSINRQTGEIRLASVFRDSYLRIDPEGQYDKINEAYFLGGHEQAVAALEDNLDLTIDDYATFNWKAVIDAINVLGGVDLEITDKEFAYINSFITETVESTGVGSYQLEHSGMNHLDGVQAVAYARLRLMDTDFNRTERQRKVLGLAMEKAKAADRATLKTLIGAVFPQVSTSIGVDDLLGMAKNAKKYYIGQTSGFPFAHVEMKIGKKACVVPATLESNVIQLHGFLYDDNQYQISGTVREISSHIASESGVGEPGKDTESGKNVGDQGSGEGSGAPARQDTQAPSTQPEPAPSGQDSPQDPSEQSDGSQESEVGNNASREQGSEGSQESEAGEDGQTGNHPSDDPESGAPGSGDRESGGSDGPGNDKNSIQPSSGNPGNQMPAGDTPSSGGNRQPTGSLEAPGANNNNLPTQPGPGTTGSGNGNSGSSGGPGVAGVTGVSGAPGSSSDSGNSGSPGTTPEDQAQSGSGNGAVAGPGM